MIKPDNHGFNKLLKEMDRQCMVIELRISIVETFLRIHLRHIKRFNDV